MKQSKKHTALFISCSLLLLVIGMVLAVRSGSVPISFSDIFNSIFNYNETLELMLVKDVRIPRALCIVSVSYTHLVGVLQDSSETALNSSTDVLFTAAAEFAERRKSKKESLN